LWRVAGGEQFEFFFARDDAFALVLTAPLQVMALAGFWIDIGNSCPPCRLGAFSQRLRLTIEPVLAFMLFAPLVQNAIENLAHTLAHKLVDTTRWIK
jgi:hypothetical protein